MPSPPVEPAATMPGASPPATATVGGPTTLDTSATDDDGTAGALPAAAFDETSASESLSTLSLTSSDESEADESEVVGGDGEQRNVHRPLDDPLDEALIGEVLAEQSIGGDRVHVDVDESAVDRPQQMPALMPPPALDDAETPELASALVPLALDMDTTDLLPRDKMVDGVSGASRRLPRDRASMPLPRTISPVDSASDASVSPTRETTSLSPVIVKASVSPAARRASEESAPLQRPISASTEAPSTFLAFVSGYIGYELRAMASSDQSVDVAAHEIKRERVSNFLSVPREIERLMLFGYLVCLDTFLNVFTLFPFRVFVAATSWLMSRGKRRLSTEQKCDLLKAALLLICCYFLTYLDASRLYHSIRGQAVIKLYVIFNVLEIGDRLCCSFGQDILDSLFSRATVTGSDILPSSTAQSASPSRLPHTSHLRPVPHFFLALFYIFGHTLVLFYQMVTLNVAINSHNNALLTLLVSNQFVEIKGSVFKKFEKENLFQLSCSDIVERFQVSIFLVIITVRNLLEFSFDNSWLTSMFTLGPMTFPVGWPTEWASVHQLGTWMYGCLLFPLDTLVSLPMVLFHFLAFTVPQSAYTIISQPFAFSLDIDSYLWRVEALIIPALVVFGSEVLVDWLKHAFITKFNMIRPAVYGKYLDILCRDYLLGTTKDMTARTDDRLSRYGHPAVVSRRIGFASIPLACLVIRVFIQGFSASVMATCPFTIDSHHLANKTTAFLEPHVEYAYDMVADTFWPHSAPRMTIQTAPFESTDRFMTKHKSTTAPSPSTSRSSFDYNTTREPMLSAFRGMFSAIKTVFCMGYFQAILTVLFIPLLGLKCFVGYVLVRYARHRYIAVQSRFRERSASRPATDDIGVSYGGSVSSNNSKRRPPLFVPSTVSAVSAHPQHYSSARFVGSVPSSPANYSVVRRNIGISSRATDTTQTTNSPLHRESSTVMMDNVAYGNEDPRSVSSSVVASPIAKLPGSVEFQRANTPGRRDSQSLKVEEIAGEEGLHAEETAFIGGTFKVDDPQAVPVSLDTIDRYMLYKSRIP